MPYLFNSILDVTTNEEIVELHIRNATLDELNVNDSTWRRLISRLRSLSITDGKIGSVVGEFARLTTISCLNLSSNSIGKFGDRTLVNLFNLTILDLSHNNLTDVPRFKKEGNVTLDVSGLYNTALFFSDCVSPVFVRFENVRYLFFILDNKPLECSHLFDALKRSEINFKNKNETYCLSSKTFHWFNSTELVPLAQVESVYEVRRPC